MQISFEYDNYEWEEKVLGVIFIPDHIYTVKVNKGIRVGVCAASKNKLNGAEKREKARKEKEAEEDVQKNIFLNKCNIFLFNHHIKKIYKSNFMIEGGMKERNNRLRHHLFLEYK